MIRQRQLWCAGLLLAVAGPLHGETRVVATDRHEPVVVGRNSSAARTPAVLQRPLAVPPPAPVGPQRPSDPNIDLLSAPDHVDHHRTVRFCGLPATSPAAAVWHLYSAIERGDLDGLAGRLTDDYRFISNDPGFLEIWPEGFDRAGELNFVKRLSESVRDVAISYEALSIDPPTTAFRAAPGTYRVHVTGASMQIVEANGRSMTAGPSEHWIEVVCLRVPATGSRVATCSVRRWAEQATIEPGMMPVPDAVDGVVVPPEDAQPDALDIRVLSNGRYDGVPSLALSIPLPGPAKLEMFDVAGRRVESREFTQLQRGIHRIGIRAPLPSGVYWARVRQAGATRSARVVIVR